MTRPVCCEYLVTVSFLRSVLSIKRCSGQSRLLPHKLNTETVHKTCENDRNTIVPYSQYYASPMQTMLF